MHITSNIIHIHTYIIYRHTYTQTHTHILTSKERQRTIEKKTLKTRKNILTSKGQLLNKKKTYPPQKSD